MNRTRPLHFQHFASLQAMQRWIEATPATWTYKQSRTGTASQSWDLNAGWEGALKLARDGWREGGAAFATGLATLPAMEPAPAWTLDVGGFFPDVPRYLTGRPDCMWNEAQDPDAHRKPTLTLVVSTAANCGTDAKAMGNYGMAIAHYVDELENAGLQVEVIACIAERYSRADAAWTWTVKAAGERMNLETVAFSIAHPACFRRLGFALIERLPVSIPQEYGYGTAQATARWHIAPSDFKDAVILNGMINANSHSATREGAYRHVVAEIEAARAELDNAA